MPPSRMQRQFTGGSLQEGHHRDEPDDCMAELDEGRVVSVCMIGTGEYTTGYVHGQASDSDKSAGVFLPSKILHGPDVGRTLEMGEFLRAGSLRTISVLFARAPLREPGTSTDLRVSCVGAPVPFVAAETMMYHPNVGRIVLALRDLTDSALFASTTQKLVESVHLEQASWQLTPWNLPTRSGDDDAHVLGSLHAIAPHLSLRPINAHEELLQLGQGNPGKTRFVALTMVDLRRRGKVDRLGLCGTNGTKFAGIRAHMQRAIGDVYQDMDLTMQTWPAEDCARDPTAYKEALDSFDPGDACTIFTPDDTHFDIAMEAVSRRLHVLVTKPVVKTLEEHRRLHEAANAAGVLVMVEVHKRFDPIYTDARDRIKTLGGMSYMCSYMSQPKHQLETFRAWAGKSSDISYYLNSHHVDFQEWANQGIARPVRVTAAGSTGVASGTFNMETEDSITLLVEWENFEDKSKGTAVYTSSWVAPKADVHSQQRFFYMGHKGEITVDQAHRGYTVAKDGDGFRSVNPLFMKYAPTNGYFSGQSGYGYRSFDAFIDAVHRIGAGVAKPEDFDDSLATIATTYLTTAILEAGRLSLDAKGRPHDIFYEGDDKHIPTRIAPASF